MNMLNHRRSNAQPAPSRQRSKAKKASAFFLGRRLAITSLLGVTLLMSSLAAAAVTPLVLIGIGQADSKLEFLAKGPLGLKIVGKSRGHVDANEKASSIEIIASMKHFDTGIKLRDDHLRDTIEAEKFPTAIIRVKRSALKFPADQKTLQASAKGQLTFHGKSNPIQFDYQAARTGSDYHIKGKLTFDITDFGLEKPCHLGQCVDENVKIKTAFKLREK
jgi:hypothetical protein